MARSSYSPRLGCGVSFRVPAVSGEEDVSSILQVLAGKFPVGHPASDNLFHDCGESFRVRKVPSVVAESLFIDIAEQVERLNADVRAMQTALQETPEILHGVGVDVPIHVFDGVVDDGVLIIAFKTIIGFQFIAKDGSARFDSFADQGLKVFLLSSIDVLRYDLAATLHHPEHNFFALRSAAGDFLGTLRLVHIPGLAADEGFVYFNFATQLIEAGSLHGKPNPVHHEPCGFLGDLQPAMDLEGTDAVLATDNQPSCAEPLLKRNRGVLKDRSE